MTISSAFTRITDYHGIIEYRLNSNRLKVLLVPRMEAPVVAFMVVYHVGSRNEAVGHTGSTHLLEHLLFKGTPTFNKQAGTQIASVLQRHGALFNADTWNDRTRYYELLPSDQLELAIHLEADRMRNSFIADEDRQSEMVVVRNELERGENDPSRILDERLWSAAFREHPYHHPTIGWRSDVEGVATSRLKIFYDTFYYPNNATAIIVGDFEEEAALNLIEKHFGGVPSSGHEIPATYTVEPPQEGEVRFVLRRAGQLGLIAMGWHIPEATHEDSAALSVLDHVLSSGVSSRLYQALVEKQLAVSVSAQSYQFRDPGLFTIEVTLAPEIKHADVENIVHTEIDRLRNHDVTPVELRRAQNMIVTQIIFLRDSALGVVNAIGEAESVADWKLYVDLPARVEEVTIADLRRIVSRYFTEDNRTIGYFIPRETP